MADKLLIGDVRRFSFDLDSSDDGIQDIDLDDQTNTQSLHIGQLEPTYSFVQYVH